MNAACWQAFSARAGRIGGVIGAESGPIRRWGGIVSQLEIRAPKWSISDLKADRIGGDNSLVAAYSFPRRHAS